MSGEGDEAEKFQNLMTIDKEVADIRANIVGESTKNLYCSSQIRFLIWLYHSRPQLLTSEFLEFAVLSNDIEERADAVIDLCKRQAIPTECFGTWISYP